MGHLAGAGTERRITSIEVVSDDSQRVLKISVDDKGVVTIAERQATESYYEAKQFARLDKNDAEAVGLVLQGGHISPYTSIATQTIDGLSTSSHTLPKPEAEKSSMDGDCTPLDIERAKAENLKEQREIIELEMERDHALDRHITADVPGCPACDRKRTASYGARHSGLTDLEARGQTMPADSAEDGIPF